MAEFFDLHDDDNGNAENITNQVTEQPAQVPQEPQQTQATPELPEKYKNKSVEDIIRMHQEAEKLIGKQAQEVGEVRKLADELIKQQINVKHDVQTTPKAQEIDFFDDPKKAVNQEIENNPVLKELQQHAAIQKQLLARATVEKAHPDFLSIVGSNEFNEWCKGSKVRIQLLAQAENFDADAGIELLDTFKALKGIKQQATQAADESLKKADDESRTKQLKAAAVPAGGTGESSKPIYRRADLIRLKMEDPARYENMADDILMAYAEGRVK